MGGGGGGGGGTFCWSGIPFGGETIPLPTLHKFTKETLMCSSALSHLAFISADSSSPYMWVAFLAFISRCKVYYAALLAWFFSFWSEHIAQN